MASTLARSLMAWGLLGFAFGFVTGARLIGANPSLQAHHAPIGVVLGALYALGALVVGLFVSVAAQRFRRSPAQASFRGNLVPGAAFLLILGVGMALASSTPGYLLAGALALAGAVALSSRLPQAATPGATPATTIGNWVLALVVLALLGAGTSMVAASESGQSGPYEPFQAAFEPPPGPVVLVGIDGADWRRIDALLAEGRLPTLAGLLSRGTRAPLATSTPTWSPILWTTIATGRPASEHGVLDFSETPLPGFPGGVQRLRKAPLVPGYSGLRTVLQSLYGVGLLKEQPISARHRRVKAIWNVVSDVGGRVAVVNWFASWPCEQVNGTMVSDRNPQRAAFLFARKGLELQLAWNVTWPPELLDELAGIGSPVVGPGTETVLSLPIFAELSPDERTALAADPRLLDVFRHIYESDGFALTAARELLRDDPPDFAAVYASGVDNVSHRFHQPGVVDRYYEYVDGLLSGLVEAAGPMASFVVVSDHGFEYEDTERLAHDHGPDGILILSGPAFRAGASLERTPCLVDVAPTVLALLGLPLADTLAGAPVLEAFAPGVLDARPLAAVPSYGRYAPPTGPALETPDALQDEVMEKLRALGYVAE